MSGPNVTHLPEGCVFIQDSLADPTERRFFLERAALLFADPQAEQNLIDNTVSQMLARGYGGVDVDFEFLGAALAASYASFVGRLRAAVNAAGGELIAALAPKASATQPGVLYEGHDYAAIAANADAVLLMT